MTEKEKNELLNKLSEIIVESDKSGAVYVGDALFNAIVALREYWGLEDE